MGTPVQRGHSLGRPAARQGMKALRRPAGRASWVGTFPFFLHPPRTPALVSSLCFKAPDTASSAVSAQAPPILFQLRPSALTRSVACRSIYRLKGLQTPPYHSTVPPPRTCLGAQQAFWIQISAACGRNVPGPQHRACQPSSQGGPPSGTKRPGKQEGADREHLPWTRVSPAAQEASRADPGPPAPPGQGWGSEVSALSADRVVPSPLRASFS